MPSSQVPAKIADAPQAIVDLSRRNHQVKINLRADQWPLETIEAVKRDRLWQIRIKLYNGLLMSPWLTDFFKELRPRDTVVISSQETDARVVTTIGTVKEVFWIAANHDDQRYGVHAAIRLERKYRYGSVGGQVWGNYILAIAQVRKTASPLSVRDPRGERFVETVNKFSVV